MHAVPSLLECQEQFLAGLYNSQALDATRLIAGNGLTPEARLRIYRHSSEETHFAALRTTYPAVRALVGRPFFDQSARGYRRSHPSTSGNLQQFGATFAAYLETLQACHSLPYLPDVARLEWLRQETVLAPESPITPSDALARVVDTTDEVLQIVLHPSVHLLASPHAVMTIWRYVMRPTHEGLALPPQGENVVTWRSDGEVAMAALDAASYACVAALARSPAVRDACTSARAIDDGFDSYACLLSLAKNGLVSSVSSALARRRS